MSKCSLCGSEDCKSLKCFSMIQPMTDPTVLMFHIPFFYEPTRKLHFVELFSSNNKKDINDLDECIKYFRDKSAALAGVPQEYLGFGDEIIPEGYKKLCGLDSDVEITCDVSPEKMNEEADAWALDEEQLPKQAKICYYCGKNYAVRDSACVVCLQLAREHRDKKDDAR